MDEGTPATLEVESSAEGDCVLRLAGRLDKTGAAALWSPAMAAFEKAGSNRLTIDATGVTWCDGAGAALLIALERSAARAGGQGTLTGLREPFASLLALYDPQEFLAPPPDQERSDPVPEHIGRFTASFLDDLRETVSFIGEMVVGLAAAVARPRTVRWREVGNFAELVGVNALPIVMLVGFLMGFILAFQSAVPLKKFGAEIYVASMVALSLFRELGPLMTAIVLAGRSGSAFAAEIGTMKVNEEIDAIKVMGLDPMRFLVIPRILGATLMTPVLAVFANLAGLAGGAMVFSFFGFPLSTFISQVQFYVDLKDPIGGLVKAGVFGLIVAGVGCRRGLQTGSGASAVGASTTSSVVTSIVLIVCIDGIFSVIYNRLGI